MTKPTHYADITETTTWRVRFTPPVGLNDKQLQAWLFENWADPDAPGIADKDIYADGWTELITIAPIPTE